MSQGLITSRVVITKISVIRNSLTILTTGPVTDHTSEVWWKSGQSLSQMDKTTVRPVVSGHSKIDKTKVLKTNGSLMKVKCIAECSRGAFCSTFDLY